MYFTVYVILCEEYCFEGLFVLFCVFVYCSTTTTRYKPICSK
jgi:hypothetical protein